MQSWFVIGAHAGAKEQGNSSGRRAPHREIVAEDTGGRFSCLRTRWRRTRRRRSHLHPRAHDMTGLRLVVTARIPAAADGQRSRVRSAGMSFVPKGVVDAFISSPPRRAIGIPVPQAPGKPFSPSGASDPAHYQTATCSSTCPPPSTAAANPRAFTILGPPPFAPTAGRQPSRPNKQDVTRRCE